MQDNKYERETYAESDGHSFNNTAWNIVLRRTKEWNPDHNYRKLLERSENRHQYEEGFIRGSIYGDNLLDIIDDNKLPQNRFVWSYPVDGTYLKDQFKRNILEKIHKELLPSFRTCYQDYIIFDWGIINCYNAWIRYYLFGPEPEYYDTKYLTHYLPELLQSCLEITPQEKTPDFPTFYLVTKELNRLVASSFTLKKEYVFNPEHYNDSVVALYKSVSENILNNPELGRLVILNGPPGTGKTHLIKNLTQDFAHKARVLFMSPDLVSQVGGPDFNKFLIEQSDYGLPIVIVVEDADFLISKRNKESVAALSALLNLGDGICGEAFDTRIICTSNEEEVYIDDAILRPGRLFCRIEVGNLEPEKANNLIKKELGDDSGVRYEQSVSLGTVFTKINTIKRNKVLTGN